MVEIHNGMSKEEAEERMTYYAREAQTAINVMFSMAKEINGELAFSIAPNLRRAQTAIKRAEQGTRQFLREEGDNLL